MEYNRSRTPLKDNSGLDLHRQRTLSATAVPAPPAPQHQSQPSGEYMNNFLKSIDSANKRIKEILQRQKGLDTLLKKDQENATEDCLAGQLSYSKRADDVARLRQKYSALREYNINHNIEQKADYQVQSKFQYIGGQKYEYLKQREPARPRREVCDKIIREDKYSRFQDLKLQARQGKRRQEGGDGQRSFIGRSEAKTEQPFKFVPKPKQMATSLIGNQLCDAKSQTQAQKEFRITLTPCETSGNSIKDKFLRMVLPQIDFDKLLRDLKRSFNFAARQQELDSLLKKKALYHVSAESLKPKMEEIDPLAVETGESQASQLVEGYLAAENHWRDSFRGAFEEWQSRKLYGFICGREKRLRLESIVTFVNVELGTFFRNRDLYLTFRRLGGEEWVEEEQFVGKLSR